MIDSLREDGGARPGHMLIGEAAESSGWPTQPARESVRARLRRPGSEGGCSRSKASQACD
eukprot:6180037-Pleurochrysis_carterae.AAC.4